MSSVLADRPLLGYPNTKVELHVNGKNYTVNVTDHTGVLNFGPTQSRAIARDWYFHPFVYGYNYPLNSTQEEGEDGS